MFRVGPDAIPSSGEGALAAPSTGADDQILIKLWPRHVPGEPQLFGIQAFRSSGGLFFAHRHLDTVQPGQFLISSTFHLSSVHLFYGFIQIQLVILLTILCLS